MTSRIIREKYKKEIEIFGPKYEVSITIMALIFSVIATLYFNMILYLDDPTKLAAQILGPLPMSFLVIYTICYYIVWSIYFIIYILRRKIGGLLK